MSKADANVCASNFVRTLLQLFELAAGMMSDDMLREQGRRNWEEEAQRRYELEQQAEIERERRVEVMTVAPLTVVASV